MSSNRMTISPQGVRRLRFGSRIRTPLKFAAVASVIGLVTAACSSSSNSGSNSGTSSSAKPPASSSAPASSASSSSAAPASPTGPLTTLTLDAAFFGPVDVPLYLAEGKGYFAEQGLDLKFVTASSNSQLAAVLSGDVQFASTSAINVIKAAQNGAQFVNFLPIEIGFSEDVIMSKKAYDASGLTANSTAKEKIQALAGKKLGVISAGGENATIFKNMFAYAGIPTSQLDMVQLGNPNAMIAALKTGQVVAENLGSPYPQTAVNDGYAVYLFKAPLSEITPLGTAVTQTLATTRDYWNNHQDLIKKFETAYAKAIAEMEADPTAAATYVYGKYFTDQPKDSFMSSFQEDYNIIAKTPNITPQQSADLKQIAQVAGIDTTNWDSFFVSLPGS